MLYVTVKNPNLPQLTLTRHIFDADAGDHDNNKDKHSNNIISKYHNIDDLHE